MPAVLITVLTWFARFLLAKFLVATTVFFVSNAIATQFFDFLHVAINQQIGALPGQISSAVTLIGVPEAISVVFSAYTTALTLKGLSRLAPSGAAPSA